MRLTHILEPILAKFVPSKPVFKIYTDSIGDYVNAEQKYPRAKLDPSEDVIVNILEDYYRESFRGTKFEMNDVQMIKQLNDTMFEDILDFIEHHMQLKRPRQHPLFKFYDDIADDPEWEYGAQLILDIYRYMLEEIEDLRTDNGTVAEKNVLALLNVIRERYEERQKAY